MSTAVWRSRRRTERRRLLVGKHALRHYRQPPPTSATSLWRVPTPAYHVEMTRRSVLVLVLLSSLPVLAAGESALRRAEKEIEELRYADAQRSLEAARQESDLDQATLLRVLELQGIVSAGLHQPDKARAHFQALLSLSPEHKLSGKPSPRVRAAFLEAKGWVSERSPLRVEPALGPEGAEAVEAIRVSVVSDPLSLAREVRFFFREGDGEWKDAVVPLAKGTAELRVIAPRLAWWAKLLGERRAVLAQLGSADAPFLEPVPAKPQVVLTPAGLPTEGGLPLSLAGEQAPPPKQGSVLAPLGYGALAIAVASGIAGGVFGLRSRDARDRIARAAKDESGAMTGLTQRQANALADQAASEGTVANVLFGTAAALGVTSVVLLWAD